MRDGYGYLHRLLTSIRTTRTVWRLCRSDKVAGEANWQHPAGVAVIGPSGTLDILLDDDSAYTMQMGLREDLTQTRVPETRWRVDDDAYQ